MKKNKLLQQELESLQSFLMLVETYEEISAIRMRKVKKSVLSRRSFMQGLNDAFAYIIYSYKIYKSLLKKGSQKTLMNTNGKTIYVFLSSNTGLYGDIIKATFELLRKDIINDADADLVVVGKLGRSLVDSSLPGRKYSYYELSDIVVDEEQVRGLMTLISEYANVLVYHGVFKSILKQTAQKTFLTGEVLDIENNLVDRNVQFLFEPSIEDVASYFEKQIIALLFEQTVFESSLSKFASRMVSLDAAAENIHTKLSRVDFNLKKASHKRINSGIQATLAGGNLWTV